MSALDFSVATKEIIKKRAYGACEIHSSLENFSEDGEIPKDFPKIDLSNPLHARLEAHHCNHKSNADPYLNEDWNGIYIYKFYHDIAHGNYITHIKWTKIISNYCRMVANGRMPQRSDEERNCDRIERNAGKLEKNTKIRAKNKANRKENPWMTPAQRNQLTRGVDGKVKQKVARGKRIQLPCTFDHKTGKLVKNK